MSEFLYNPTVDTYHRASGNPAYTTTSSGSIKVTNPRMVEHRRNFQSASNPVWNVYRDHRSGRLPFSQKLMETLDGLDLGNGVFRKEEIFHKFYRDKTSIARQTGSGASLVTHSYTGAQGIGLFPGNIKTLCLSGLPTTWETMTQVQDDLFMRGAAVISDTLPNKERVNLLLSLAEIRREGLPSFRSLVSKRGDGSGFLSLEFGWLPIVSDIQQLSASLVKSRDVLRQFVRLQGKQHRRRRVIRDESVSDSFTDNGTWALYPSYSALYSGASTGSLNVNRVYTDRIWFSGAYQVLSPEVRLLTQVEAQLEQANHLLGLRPSAEVVYNLAGWTWLLDWFVNFGDVLSNYSHLGQDGVALRYGYLMRHTRVECEVTLRGVTDIVGIDRKIRVRAHPFGFGPQFDSLTQRQWSVVVALGIAKGNEIRRR
jgi:hypothetical protein